MLVTALEVAATFQVACGEWFFGLDLRRNGEPCQIVAFCSGWPPAHRALQESAWQAADIYPRRELVLGRRLCSQEALLNLELQTVRPRPRLNFTQSKLDPLTFSVGTKELVIGTLVTYTCDVCIAI